jgi:hypothetical protein
MRRRHAALAPLMALALLTASAPGVNAAGGGGGGGTNFDCSPGPPSLIAQFKDPTQIVSGSGGISCPTPGAEAPGQFGPGSVALGPPPQPAIGSACHFEFDTPVQFRLNGGIEQISTVHPANDQRGFRTPQDPANPQWQSDGWSELRLATGGSQSEADRAYGIAGTTDVFSHWTYDGTWTQVVQQIECVGSGPTLGWGNPCRINVVPASTWDCFDLFPPAIPPTSPGLPTDALGIDLNAFLRGRFTGGTITSLPAAPNHGVTNVPVCFYINGMTVNGQPADPQQDVFWEKIVQGPDVGEGRHVYFVFIIHVSYQGTMWDFGDGTTVTIPKGGSSPEQVPSQCPNVPNQQFLVAHTYHRYSTGDGFHVTANHQYGIDVTELWRDADPNAHRLDFPNAVPPVSVPSAPLPAYVIPVWQEEGVPVGSR